MPDRTRSAPELVGQRRAYEANDLPEDAFKLELESLLVGSPLVPIRGESIVYATLDRTARLEWKPKVQALRAQSESYDAISKILFTRYGLTGWDGLPLGSSTMRGMAAI